MVKNKVAPPFKEAEFDIMFGKGISKEGDILDIAVDLGIINKSGAWFAYNGGKIGQGRENAKQYLREHEETCIEVEKKVREQVLAREAEEEGQEGNPEKPAKAEKEKAAPKAEKQEKAAKPEQPNQDGKVEGAAGSEAVTGKA